MSEFLGNLNIVDYIIIVMSLIAGIYGIVKGFVGSVATKISFVAGFIMSLLFTAGTAQAISKRYSLSLILSTFIAYMVIFLATYVTCNTLSNVCKTVADLPAVKPFNKILGFVFCIFEVLVLFGLIDMLLGMQKIIDLGALTDGSFLNRRIIRPIMTAIAQYAGNFR